jgi:hypothetical protein
MMKSAFALMSRPTPIFTECAIVLLVVDEFV